LKGFRTLAIPIADEFGRSAWPEVFPVARIDEIRTRTGNRHFASQMMLMPVGTERARLDSSALRFYDADPDMRCARLGEFNITGWSLYWDPSGARKKGDASVCLFLLRDDRSRRAFVNDCLYLETDDDDPHPLATQAGIVLDFMERRGVFHIAVEVNGLGNALPEILRREADLRGRRITAARIVNHKSKVERILDAIEPMLGTGRLWAHEKIKSTGLMSEMADWSPGGRVGDDGLDALAGALAATPIPLRPRGQRVPIRANTEFRV